MTIQKIFTVLFLAFMSQAVLAERFYAEDIEVQVVNDRGRQLPEFPLRERDHDTTVKSYLEARPGQAYAIRVTNHSNERVGLVIAVDGRNIISGKRSSLKSKERKYVLGPHQQATYRGWRSSKDHVNEFYFTDEEDSYSAAFGDYSAMGVIAVAVFRDRERVRYESHGYDLEERLRRNSRLSGKSQAPSADSARRMENRAGEAASQPGTGYGDERYSRSRRVKFREERHAAATFLIKYEWRETLCRKGIVDCHVRKNRLWKDDYRWGNRGFAPPPPRYKSSIRLSRY